MDRDSAPEWPTESREAGETRGLPQIGSPELSRSSQDETEQDETRRRHTPPPPSLPRAAPDTIEPSQFSLALGCHAMPCLALPRGLSMLRGLGTLGPGSR
ncbi:hypothetical protein FALCPG4_006600 [Fusarium falciforme]